MTELQKAYKKFNFGDTSYFCPVALKENMVLHPGSPDITATYRDKIYFFTSEEAQQKFLKMPHQYVAGKLPLQVRFISSQSLCLECNWKGNKIADSVGKMGVCGLYGMVISFTASECFYT